MGIDYRENAGIGYEVVESGEITDHEGMEEGLLCYLDCQLEMGFECFQAGCAYSGVTEGVYVTVSNPFKYGLDLTRVKEELDLEVERLKLEVVGDFKVQSGLYVF